MIIASFERKIDLKPEPKLRIRNHFYQEVTLGCFKVIFLLELIIVLICLIEYRYFTRDINKIVRDRVI